MATAIAQDTTAIVADFANWLLGKENSSDSNIQAVARFAQAHVNRRPSTSADVRWDTIASMRQMAKLIGPAATHAQFDAAYAAFLDAQGVGGLYL